MQQQEQQACPAVVDALTELIGHTPMLRIRALPGAACPLLLKLESFNPGGSIKDRTAKALIDDAEQAGILRPGSTIVEPTSGNTGVGLAILAAQRGYRVIFTVRDKVSREKIDLLKAYGGTVVMCPAAVPSEHPDSYRSVARRICEELPDAWSPNQYSNLANQAMHYRTTGPEIWLQTNGSVTHFVAGAGTGGTISGVGRYLKERKPEVEIVCADPMGSIYSTPEGHAYLVEGVGEDTPADNYDPSVIDRVEQVTDAEAFEMCRRVADTEGLLMGGSGGIALAAALRVARTAAPDDVVVALIPDSGRGYVSKVYSDSWLLKHGFRRSDGEPSVADVLAGGQGIRSRALTAIPASATIGEAMELLYEVRISQLPVTAVRRPTSVGDLVGSVSLASCCDNVDAGDVHQGLERVTGEPLPIIGIGEPISALGTRINGAEWSVVADRGRPIAMISLDRPFVV